MTQHQKILDLLENGQWVCSSRFYEQFIADPRTRIAELKKQGYQLEWRWCQTHNFHTGNSKEWRLLTAPVSQNPAPQSKITPTSDYCCGNKIKGLEGHSKDCRLNVREVELKTSW